MVHRQFTLFLILIFIFKSVSGQVNKSPAMEQNAPTQTSEPLIIQQKNLPKDSTQRLMTEFKIKLESGDTVQAIKKQLRLSDIYSNKAEFAKAYQASWTALLLSDAINNPELISKAQEQVAGLYVLFNRDDEVIKYSESSIKIRKKLIAEGKISPKILIGNYYNLTIFYRQRQNYAKSKLYLDSCYQISNLFGENDTKNSYFDAERSYYELNMNNVDAAIREMERVEKWFKSKTPNYLVLLYTYMGDAYRKLNNFDKAKIYYYLAIETINTYKSHTDYLPVLNERLSTIYFERGDYKNSVLYLREAKRLTEEIFDSRSTKNKPFIAINDDYRNEKEAQNRLLQEQKLEQLVQGKRILLLQRIVLLAVVVLIIMAAMYAIHYLKIKHKMESKLLEERQEIQNQKNKEILDHKNKELAISALQLIEKDELVQQLKNALTNNNAPITESEINNIFKNISVSNAQNWKQFEARFTSVNDSFYKNLSSAYPSLTAGDLKLSALLKLNFSSKDIANLMGISNESVHTLRYRLRKKMNLERNDNLYEHLAKF